MSGAELAPNAASTSDLSVITRIAQRMHEVGNILPESAGFRPGKNRARLPHHLQCPQRMTGICFIEQAIAVACQRLSAHAANIVAGQETAGTDGYPHMLSIDFRSKLAQSIGADRIIRPS